jgi:hypothetical protein
MLRLDRVTTVVTTRPRVRSSGVGIARRGAIDEAPMPLSNDPAGRWDLTDLEASVVPILAHGHALVCGRIDSGGPRRYCAPGMEVVETRPATLVA